MFFITIIIIFFFHIFFLCFFSFISFIYFFIPYHRIVEGYDGIMLIICVSVSLSVFRQSVRLSIFSFMDDSLSKFQWIFTKLGMPIDIVKVWFGVVDGQISSIFDSCLSETCPYFHFWMIT